MLYIYIGKPRNGKSYGAVRTAFRELRDGKRCVVTTIEFLPAMREALKEAGREDRFDDIRLLSHDQVAEFFRYRGKINGEWHVLPASQRFEFSAEKDGGGVLYVLDELHLYFNARRWAKMADAVMEYLSQHGKCGDDIIAITQAPHQLDKSFRGLAQEWVQFTNQAKTKLFGWWANPPLITFSSYLDIPGPTTRAVDKGVFKISPEREGSWYRTGAGVGVVSQLADTEEPAKGLPFWTVFLALGLCVAAVFAAPKILGAMLGKLATSITSVGTSTNGFAGSVARSLSPTVSSNSVARPEVRHLEPPDPRKVLEDHGVRESALSEDVPRQVLGRSSVDVEPVRITGVVPDSKTGVLRVLYSNGRVVVHRDSWRVFGRGVFVFTATNVFEYRIP